MLGGLLTAPSNSPHLRKSGSKQVFSEFGMRIWWVLLHFFLEGCFSLSPALIECLLHTGELENGAEEGFLSPIEANDLKGVTTPVSTTAIMPSPILLWRFKVY